MSHVTCFPLWSQVENNVGGEGATITTAPKPSPPSPPTVTVRLVVNHNHIKLRI